MNKRYIEQLFYFISWSDNTPVFNGFNEFLGKCVLRFRKIGDYEYYELMFEEFYIPLYWRDRNLESLFDRVKTRMMFMFVDWYEQSLGDGRTRRVKEYRKRIIPFRKLLMEIGHDNIRELYVPGADYSNDVLSKAGGAVW